MTRGPAPTDHDRPPPGVRSAGGHLDELRSLRHLLAPYRSSARIGIGATALAAIVYLVPAYLGKVLIDDGIDKGSYRVVAWTALASLATVATLFALRYLREKHLNLLANQMVVSLQHQTFHHLKDLPLEYHRDHPIGVSLSRVTNDVTATRHLVTSGLPSLIKSLVSITGALVIMVALDWQMALATLAVVPILGVVSWAYRRAVAPTYRALREAIAAVTRDASSTLGAVDVIQAYDQATRHEAAFGRATQHNRDVEYRTIRANAAYYPATSLLTAVAMGILVIYGGVQAARGEAQVGTLVAFFGYLQMLLSPLVNLSTVFRTYQGGMAAIDKVFTVLDEPLAEASGRDGSFGNGPGDLSVRGATFEGLATWELHDVDLDIPAGQMVAVVGELGSGGSALVRAIAGLIDLDDGSVLLDGVEVASVPPSRRYDRIAFVAGDSQLFDGTVRDNLLLAAPGASDEQLIGHVESLFGSEILPCLPRGLDTPLLRNAERLPTGTRQALVIAQALLRRPSVLVLAEASDSLDPRSLERLARAHRGLLAGTTIVARTRQPLIADYADRVVVLEGGRVVEDGIPEQLLADDTGRYAALRARWGGVALAPRSG